VATLITAPGTRSAIVQLLRAILTHGKRSGDKKEILHYLITITAPDSPATLAVLRRTYSRIVGMRYWDRAETLYRTDKALSWKVSYRGRLSGSNGEESQLNNITLLLAKKPGVNALSFAFLRPIDHRRTRAMPASVPCPIAGDFKFRNGRLHLSVLFRTQDALRLGFPDIVFLRSLQRDVLEGARRIAGDRLAGARMGELNLFLARAFVFSKQTRIAARLVAALDSEQ